MSTPLDISRNTASPRSLPTPNVARAPVYNPYDKFTQSEFDEWISGITSALRQALGQEVSSYHPTYPFWSPGTVSKEQQADSSEEGESENVEALLLLKKENDNKIANENFENSFEIEKTLHSYVDKGKGRDPRDGPGFTFGIGGDPSQPIQIFSGSEEDCLKDWEGDEENEGESEDWYRSYSEEYESYRPPPLHNGEGSSQSGIHDTQRERSVDEGFNELGDNEEDFEDKDANEAFDEDEDEEDEKDEENKPKYALAYHFEAAKASIPSSDASSEGESVADKIQDDLIRGPYETVRNEDIFGVDGAERAFSPLNVIETSRMSEAAVGPKPDRSGDADMQADCQSNMGDVDSQMLQIEYEGLQHQSHCMVEELQSKDSLSPTGDREPPQEVVCDEINTLENHADALPQVALGIPPFNMNGGETQSRLEEDKFAKPLQDKSSPLFTTQVLLKEHLVEIPSSFGTYAEYFYAGGDATAKSNDLYDLNHMGSDDKCNASVQVPLKQIHLEPLDHFSDHNGHEGDACIVVKGKFREGLSLELSEPDQEHEPTSVWDATSSSPVLLTSEPILCGLQNADHGQEASTLAAFGLRQVSCYPETAKVQQKATQLLESDIIFTRFSEAESIVHKSKAEPFEDGADQGTDCPTCRCDPWDAPSEFVNGLISTGAFILDYSQSVDLIETEPPAFTFSPIIPKELRDQDTQSATVLAEDTEPSTGTLDKTTPEICNYDALYEGLPVDPLDSLNDGPGPFDNKYLNLSTSSTQVAAIYSRKSKLFHFDTFHPVTSYKETANLYDIPRQVVIPSSNFQVATVIDKPLATLDFRGGSTSLTKKGNGNSTLFMKNADADANVVAAPKIYGYEDVVKGRDIRDITVTSELNLDEVISVRGKVELKKCNDLHHDADADGDNDPDFVISRQASAATAVLGGSRFQSYFGEVGRDVDKLNQVNESSSVVAAYGHGASFSEPPTVDCSVRSDLPSILIIKRKPAKNDTDSEELTDLDDSPPIKYRSSQFAERKLRGSVSPTITLLSKKIKNLPKSAVKIIIPSNAASKNRTILKPKGKDKNKEFDFQKSVSGPSLNYPLTTHYLESKNGSAGSHLSKIASDPFSANQDGPPNPVFLPPLQPLVIHRHTHALPVHLHQKTPLPHSPYQTASADSEISLNGSKVIPFGQTGPSHKPFAPFHNSPVTRSNCRYHKISIPRDESGLRIFFLVPGCSLTNPELIMEEEILDHGDATPEDTMDLEHNMALLAFEPYLVKIMRLLVGVHMWESEVFYMRRINEDGNDLVRKLPAARNSQVTEDGDLRSSERLSASPKASLSIEGLSSASGSIIRKRKQVESSIFLGTDSEVSEHERSPKASRHRTSSFDRGNRNLRSSGSLVRPSTSKGRAVPPFHRSYTSLRQELDTVNRKSKKLRLSMSEPWTR